MFEHNSSLEENIYPKTRVASVQAEPVFMNRDATIDKAVKFIEEAASNGAKLIAFPESFIPGYPYWCRYLSQLDSVSYTKKLIKESVQIPSHALDRIRRVARDMGMYVVMGLTEKSATAHGTLYNTNVTIGPNGEIISRHRKLVPTLGEKLIWSNGDGQGLRVHRSRIGRIGTLICGENANTLARFVLIAEGEQIHIANYPALPQGDKGGYNLAKDIEIRSAAHSFEGKIFTITSSLIIGDTVRSYFSDDDNLRDIMSGGGVGHTAIYGPHGIPIAGPLDLDVESILYADIDLDDALLPKLRHDVGGGYNRFDVMNVIVNRQPHTALQEGSPLEEHTKQSFTDTELDKSDTAKD